MTNDVLRLTAEMMAIDSTSGREGELMAHVALMLESRGWRVRRIPVSPGRICVFAACVNDPIVTLSTHLDTVPPFIAPRIEAGKIHGRGACDAKGIAAAKIGRAHV